MDNFSDILTTEKQIETTIKQTNPVKSVKNQQISNSLKATKLRRENSRPVVRILKIQFNKLTLSDKKHLEGLFIEAKRLNNHFLSIGNDHYKKEKAIIKENPKYKRTYINHGDFKGLKLKVLNKRGKNEVRDIKFLSSHMKQSIGEEIQDSIKGLSSLKKKGKKVGRLKFKKEVNSIILKQYQNTYKVFIGEKKIQIQGLKKKLKVNGIDQLKKLYSESSNELDFASAQLVKKSDGYYLHCIIYVKKENISYREYLPSVGIDTGIKDQLTLSEGNCKIQFSHINAQDLKNYKKIQKSVSRAIIIKTQHGARAKYRKKTRKELMESRSTGRNYQKRCKKLRRMKLKDCRRKEDRENKLVHTLKQSFGVVYLEDINYSGWQKLWGKQTTSNRVAIFVKKLEGVGLAKFIDRYKKSSLVCRYSNYSPPEFAFLSKFDRLKIRGWHCECCDEEKDRDLEASKVINEEGRMIHRDTRNIDLTVSTNSIKNFLRTIQTISNINTQLV